MSISYINIVLSLFSKAITVLTLFSNALPPCRRIIDPLIGHKACPGKRMYLLSKYLYLERCSQLSQVLPRLTSHQKMRKLSLFRILLMETFGFLSPSFKMFLALLNNQIIMSLLGHIFITKCNNRTR